MPMSEGRPFRSAAVGLLREVTCPHCWQKYAPEESLWISQHSDLLGDPRLGAEQQLRFLPTRFTVEGHALDARGAACQGLACPHCHLPVPRAMLEMKHLFFSILGTPASGKSYFLTSMVWQLRQTLPQFGLAFNDADPTSNRMLHEYEELQFLNPDRDSLVAIRKTELQGDLYDTVLYGEQAVSYPRPLLFSLRPLDSHPNRAAAAELSRAMCLYDNAGEHFLPGADTASSPVTRHLARSQVLFYLFDPTQDPRFRQACEGQTDDPQMLDRARTIRQELVLQEAADRVRRYAGLAQNARHRRPLVVIVTKFDAWRSLLELERLDTSAAIRTRPDGLASLDVNVVESMSRDLRALFMRLSPEIVAAAESFAEHVIYVPVSALGRGPEVDSRTGALGVRPRDVRPMWVEIPFLYALCRWSKGVIPEAPGGPKTIRLPGENAAKGEHAKAGGPRTREKR
jgi:hypothetical protein